MILVNANVLHQGSHWKVTRMKVNDGHTQVWIKLLKDNKCPEKPRWDFNTEYWSTPGTMEVIHGSKSHLPKWW